MLEKLHGVPQRIATLKAKLAARDGKAEYKENCKAIRAEIERLETVTASRDALVEFIDEQAPVASTENKDVTL
jgi:hypothetical protein